MGRYLIDSNVISSYFSELYPEEGMGFITNIIDQKPNISIITEIESLSWVNPDKNKEAIVKMFIEDCNILSLSREVASICVKIRRSRKIKMPDAIIAATAIAHKLTLITRDRDFNNIRGLKIIDPFAIK